MHLIDNARRLVRGRELAQNASRNRRGLRRARGEEAGESARYDGQRNNSSHYDSFLLVGASEYPRYYRSTGSYLVGVIRAQVWRNRLNLS